MQQPPLQVELFHAGHFKEPVLECHQGGFQHGGRDRGGAVDAPQSGIAPLCNLGAFGAVELNWWAFGLVTFAWLGLAGAVTAVIVAWIRSRGAEDEVEDDAEDEEPHLPGAEEVPAIAAPAAEEPEAPAGASPSRVIEAELVDDTAAPATPVAPQDAGVEAEVVVDAEVEEDAPTEEPDSPADAGESPESDLPRRPATPSD